MEPMKTLLVRNPVAGQRDVEDDLRRVLSYLAERGWDVSVRLTERQGHATELAREAAAQGYDMVVAVGGDGTIGEVAEGLVGTTTTLGVLPVGTGNQWAHMLDLPVWSPVYRSALLDASRILVEGDHRRIDVGKADEHYFVMWCGIGFDAQVAQDVEPHREARRNLGNLTYFVVAVAEAFFMRGTRTTVVVDGRALRYRAMLVVIANAQLYGASFKLAPEARLDDGLLDIFVFRGSNLIDVFWHYALLALGRHAGSRGLDVLRGRNVYVLTEDTLPTHVDGNPVGTTPLSVEVIPRALSVVVPGWSSASLFCEGGGTVGSEITAAARLRREWERLKHRWQHA